MEMVESRENAIKLISSVVDGSSVERFLNWTDSLPCTRKLASFDVAGTARHSTAHGVPGHVHVRTYTH